MTSTSPSGGTPSDLAGGTPEQWTQFYVANPQADALRGLRSAVERAILAAAIDLGHLEHQQRITELGCGDSRFLPQLAVRRGVRVAGVDFSQLAIDRTWRAFDQLGVDSSEIEFGDIDSYVERHPSEFDAVLSFGLIEHFADLDQILSAHFACAKPGGRVFVSAPNLSGLNLKWARLVSPETFSLERTVTTVWHRPISAHEVADAFRRLGATDLVVEHVGGPRLWAYPQRIPGRSPLQIGAARLIRRLVNGAGEGLNRLHQGAAGRLAGVQLSPDFVVAGTRSE